ncbi:MAG: saccharopine dehydrogenase NADP-binding domain-containing protein [Acidobacteriota bacterium]|nr:saccharopine dehydrogenase NADP-binding domain-containing protein [Acidobacteriota bacterium]
MKILVLGAGRMGLGAAYDLAHNSGAGVETIMIADIDLERARAVAETIRSKKVTPVQVDVGDAEQVVGLMRGQDAAISCVTYFHNLQLARAAIEAQVNFCDLGGNNAVVDAELALDEEARAAGITSFLIAGWLRAWYRCWRRMGQRGLMSWRRFTFASAGCRRSRSRR